MVGDIVNDRETDTSQAETWLRANSHRLDLGRIGFRWMEDGAERPLTRPPTSLTLNKHSTSGQEW